MGLDNFELRDGNTNLFGMRSKDVSVAGDGSLQYARHLATPYPVDYGTGGCYQSNVSSGTIGAGMSANAPVFAFRNPSSVLNCIIRRISVFQSSVTGYTAGFNTLTLTQALPFSVLDTVGNTPTITKLRSTMASAAALMIMANTAALTPGTRTLLGAMEAITTQAPTTANTVFGEEPYILFDKRNSGHPLVLAQNEGFILTDTVPATGTQVMNLTIEWDEVPLVNY